MKQTTLDTERSKYKHWENIEAHNDYLSIKKFYDEDVKRYKKGEIK